MYIPVCPKLNRLPILYIIDRYVLLGNHIDAWVNGAVDATSGTTVMMEIARVVGEKAKTGKKQCGGECLALHIESQFNKNSLLQSTFSVFAGWVYLPFLAPKMESQKSGIR